jgi:glycosyltransferase involved in cell wall biosynthesis
MTIYYTAPDARRAFGGVRMIYRHVDILNEAGFSAYVLHAYSPFTCTWFDHDTPVRHMYTRPRVPGVREVVKGPVRGYSSLPHSLSRAIGRRVGRPGYSPMALAPGDVLAVSGVMAQGDYKVYPGVPRVIFNQGAYSTFRRWTPESDPYARDDVLGVMTVSSDSEEYLRTALPDRLPILRVRYSIDPSTFSYSAAKEKRIVYMPRKNSEHAHQVMSILALRGKLDDWDVVTIEGARHDEVAALLRSSAVFLSFGGPEGFGLPPAEAMSAGCVVVGYHGGGGKEFFRPDFSYPVEFGDIRSYVEAVEQVLERYDRDREGFLAVGRAASDFIQSTYSPEHEAQDVVQAWKQFLEAVEPRAPETVAVS